MHAYFISLHVYYFNDLIAYRPCLILVSDYSCNKLQLFVLLYEKNNVYGFFDNGLHEVNWHFATQEAARPNGF